MTAYHLPIIRACLMCMPYVYALYVSRDSVPLLYYPCMPYVYALCVCLICVRCMYALYAHSTVILSTRPASCMPVKHSTLYVQRKWCLVGRQIGSPAEIESERASGREGRGGRERGREGERERERGKERQRRGEEGRREREKERKREREKEREREGEGGETEGWMDGGRERSKRETPMLPQSPQRKPVLRAIQNKPRLFLRVLQDCSVQHVFSLSNIRQYPVQHLFFVCFLSRMLGSAQH